MAFGKLLGGAALSLGGGLMADRERRKGLKSAKNDAAFNPWNVNSPFFGASFDKDTGTVNATMSEPFKQLTDQLMAQIGGNMSANPQDFYDKLSALSQRDEAQQMFDMESRLFNQGRLGTTGGALQQNALHNSMADARLKRELNAYDLQGNLFNQALQGLGQLTNINQAALAPAGMGSGIGINMSQIMSGFAPYTMDNANKKADMWSGLFGGLSSGLFG